MDISLFDRSIITTRNYQLFQAKKKKIKTGLLTLKMFLHQVVKHPIGLEKYCATTK